MVLPFVIDSFKNTKTLMIRKFSIILLPLISARHSLCCWDPNLAVCGI